VLLSVVVSAVVLVDKCSVISPLQEGNPLVEGVKLVASAVAGAVGTEAPATSSSTKRKRRKMLKSRATVPGTQTIAVVFEVVVVEVIVAVVAEQQPVAVIVAIAELPVSVENNILRLTRSSVVPLQSDSEEHREGNYRAMEGRRCEEEDSDYDVVLD